MNRSTQSWNGTDNPDVPQYHDMSHMQPGHVGQAPHNSLSIHENHSTHWTWQAHSACLHKWHPDPRSSMPDHLQRLQQKYVFPTSPKSKSCTATSSLSTLVDFLPLRIFLGWWQSIVCLVFTMQWPSIYGITSKLPGNASSAAYQRLCRRTTWWTTLKHSRLDIYRQWKIRSMVWVCILWLENQKIYYLTIWRLACPGRMVSYGPRWNPSSLPPSTHHNHH